MSLWIRSSGLSSREVTARLLLTRCLAAKASKTEAAPPLEPLPLYVPKPAPFPQLPDIIGLKPADLDIPPHPNFKKPWHQLLTRIELEHRLRYDPDGRTNLFRTGTPEEVFPGSVLSVEQITSRSSPKTQVYTGLLKSVRKNGISTSIVLESLVLGTKVTMRFMIYSPMITRISVLKRADKAVVDAAVEEEEETLEKPLEEQPL